MKALASVRHQPSRVAINTCANELIFEAGALQLARSRYNRPFDHCLLEVCGVRDLLFELLDQIVHSLENPTI